MIRERVFDKGTLRSYELSDQGKKKVLLIGKSSPGADRTESAKALGQKPAWHL